MNWIIRPGLAFLKGDVNAHVSMTTYGWTWHVYNKDYTVVMAESPTQLKEIDGVDGYVYIGESTLADAQQKVERFIEKAY